MTTLTARGRLASWDGTQPNLRDWTDEELLDGLRQLGISTDREAFAARAQTATTQAQIEDEWLSQLAVQDEGLAVFTWMSVQELWERWRIAVWPSDRLARMFAYLVDADYAVEWADRFHAPTAIEVMDALDDFLGRPENGLPALEHMVESLGMPVAAWPGKMLDAMAEWNEVGNISLSRRGGAFLARMLGRGHETAYLAVSLITARMYDRAHSAALEVPLDATLDQGFDEVVGYLCLAAGDVVLAAHWIGLVDARHGRPAGEMTLAAEAVRSFLDTWSANGKPDGATIDDRTKGAARQAAAQACFYAIMAFAGDGTPGGAG